MASPSPLQYLHPLEEVDRIDVREQIGHLTFTEEDIQRYIYHLEEAYLNSNPIFEMAPFNKWGNYAKAIVTAMKQKFRVNEEDHKFLTVNMGYLFHKIVTDHAKDIRSRSSVVSNKFSEEEVHGIQRYSPDQECARCRVGHLSVGLPTECIASYGPLEADVLHETTLPLNNYAAMVIGTKALLSLHEFAIPIFLNVGITNLEELSYEHIKTGLAEKVRKRIKLLANDSCMPILVEFFYDSKATESVPRQLYTAIRTLAQIQREYNGPIVLIIPPYRILSRDTICEYNEGKRRHQVWVKMGMLIGKMLGLAVCSLYIQSEYKDNQTVTNPPTWVIEPLFNEEKQCTREYYRRIHETLVNLVKALVPWIVTIPERQACQGYRPQMVRYW